MLCSTAATSMWRGTCKHDAAALFYLVHPIILDKATGVYGAVMLSHPLATWERHLGVALEPKPWPPHTPTAPLLDMPSCLRGEGQAAQGPHPAWQATTTATLPPLELAASMV